VRAVRESALRTAADSADSVRRTADEGFAQLDHLRAGMKGTQGVAELDLDDALTEPDVLAQA
jgi:hypothetical protein